MKKKIQKENTTKCGEFICSKYNWLTLEEQKKQAKEMAKMTKKKNNKK